jgi:hypothetical protein
MLVLRCPTQVSSTFHALRLPHTFSIFFKNFLFSKISFHTHKTEEMVDVAEGHTAPEPGAQVYLPLLIQSFSSGTYPSPSAGKT